MINRQLKQSKEDLSKGFFTDRSGRNVWRSGSLRAEEICPDPGSPRPGQAFGDPGDPAGAHPKRRGLPRRRALVAAAFLLRFSSTCREVRRVVKLKPSCSISMMTAS